MKTAKKIKTRVTLAQVIDGPFMEEKANGFTIYFKSVNKKGAEVPKKISLYTHNPALAQTRFDAWKAKNGYGDDAKPATPNLPAVIDPAEKKRQKAREYYHNRKNGNGGDGAPKGGDKVIVDRAVLDAVMQSLSSSLQSVAASVRILDTILHQGR